MSDPDRDRRQAALEICHLYASSARLTWSIGEHTEPDPPWAAALRRIALSDPDFWLRFVAISALAASVDPAGSPEVQLEVLEAGLADADAQIRFYTLAHIKRTAKLVREHPTEQFTKGGIRIASERIRALLDDDDPGVRAEAARALLLGGLGDANPFALFGPGGISGPGLSGADALALVVALVGLEPRMRSQAELESLGEQIHAVLTSDVIDKETADVDLEILNTLDPHPRLAEYAWRLVSADNSRARRWGAALWAVLRPEEPERARLALVLEDEDEWCRTAGARALRRAEVSDPILIKRSIDAVALADIGDPDLFERSIDTVTVLNRAAIGHLATLLSARAPDGQWQVAVRHLESVLSRDNPHPGAFALARALVPTCEGGCDRRDREPVRGHRIQLDDLFE